MRDFLVWTVAVIFAVLSGLGVLVLATILVRLLLHMWGIA